MSQLVVSAQTQVFDDWEFNDQDNPVSPGGKDFVDALADQLGQHSPIAPYKSYGWAFKLPNHEPPLWCMIGMGPGKEEYYFWSQTRPSFWKGLIGRGPEPHEGTLRQIKAIIEVDDRFENVRIIPPEN